MKADVHPRSANAIAPEILLDVANVSLSFGGVKAITDVSFDIRKGEIRAIIGPNGAGKTSMLNVINGFYHPQQGTITFKGEKRKEMRPYVAASQGISRTFQNVALFKGMTTLDNIMSGPHAEDEQGAVLAGPQLGAGARRGTAQTGSPSSASSIFSRSSRSARRRSASCPTACRSASNSAVPWPWSRNCCCSTSRWPA